MVSRPPAHGLAFPSRTASRHQAIQRSLHTGLPPAIPPRSDLPQPSAARLCQTSCAPPAATEHRWSPASTAACPVRPAGLQHAASTNSPHNSPQCQPASLQHLRLQQGSSRLRSSKIFAKLSQIPLLYSDSSHNLCMPETENSLINYAKIHDQTRANLCFSHQMTSFVSSTHLKQQNKDWQEQRKDKLTASTFGGAIGMWPCRKSRVQLWLEKIGAMKPFSGNDATCWEKLKERVALHQYKLITGYHVEFIDFKLYNENNPNDDWLAASPDGIITNLPSEGVLEIKCPFFHGNMGHRMPWCRVPVHCMPQAQGLMEILDLDWLDLFCWTPKANRLFRIPRDKDYWDLLKAALSDFWWEHVQPAREILSKASWEEANKELEPLVPAARHKLFNRIACASRHLSYRSERLPI